MSSESERIYGRRRYPSKKGQRKAKRNSAGSSTSNRIEFDGGISISNSFEAADEETSSTTIADEMTKLRSLVDPMVMRMELYEQCSDGLPLKSPAVIKKSKIAKEGTVEKNSDKQRAKKKKSKKKRKTNRQSSGTTTREENVDKSISKLEKTKKVYEERLDLTTNHFEILKENQALTTNKRIIADYQQRLEAKNKKSSQTKERPPRIPKEKAEQLIDSTDRSKSNLSSTSTAKSADEESSLWDSGRIDYNTETDESSHTISTSSDRSVRFNSTVQVATCLSRYEMNPKEKFDYWSSDGDEEMSDDLLEMLTQKWTFRKQIEDAESELIAHKKEDKNLLGEDKRLPTFEREGREGYTYTISIQD